MSLTTAWNRVRSFRPNGQPLTERSPEPPTAAAPPASEHVQAASSGFVVTPHSSRWPRAVRVAALVALLLFAIQGLVGQVARLTGGLGDDPAPVAAPPSLDAAVARQLATAYAADYWSFDSSTPGSRADAVARWTGLTAGTDAAWEGTGQLRADLVTAGEAVPDGDAAVIVQTLTRVTPAVLANDAAAPGVLTTASDDPQPRAADPGPIAEPWQATDPRWLTLNVAVALTDDGPRVTGATLAGDAPAVIATTTEVDARATSQTSDFVEDVFTAYAEGGSDLAYITTPDVQLTGLAGLVTMTDVSSWQLSPPDGDGTRTATVNVTWQLTGTSLSITQPYALRVIQTDGRWLVAAISTDQED